MEHELVVATPHLGASTSEAQVKVAQEIARSFLDAKEGKPLQGVVRLRIDDIIGKLLAIFPLYSAGKSQLMREGVILFDEFCKQANLIVKEMV